MIVPNPIDEHEELKKKIRLELRMRPESGLTGKRLARILGVDVDRVAECLQEMYGAYELIVPYLPFNKYESKVRLRDGR